MIIEQLRCCVLQEINSTIDVACMMNHSLTFVGTDVKIGFSWS